MWRDKLVVELRNLNRELYYDNYDKNELFLVNSLNLEIGVLKPKIIT